MSKIVLLSDTHWGCHKSHPAFLDGISNFFKRVFFPYLLEHDIDTVVHLGDLVDSRRTISFQTMDSITMDFIAPIVANGMKCYIIPGNHDAPHKNSLKYNATRELLCAQNNFIVHDEPVEISLFRNLASSIKCLMVPWICDENREQTQKLLNKTRAKVVFGHFQLNGYAMHKGRLCEDGMDDKKLQSFDLVVSGHFHERSRNGVVHYLGAPCEYTWADAGCRRGFGVLDTETLKIKYVDNPNYMFVTLIYDDGFGDLPNIQNKMVRVVVRRKTSQSDFDLAMKTVEDAGPLSLRINDENKVDATVDDVDIEESYDENPTKIFGDFLRSMQESQGLNKKEVERILVWAHDASYASQ